MKKLRYLILITLACTLAGCATRPRISGLGIGGGIDPATGAVSGTVTLQFFRK